MRSPPSFPQARFDRGGEPALAAREDELEALAQRGGKRCVGIEQADDVLARLERSREQDVGPLQPIPLHDLSHLLLGARTKTRRVDRRRDHGDVLLGHVEALDEFFADARGDRDQAVRAADRTRDETPVVAAVILAQVLAVQEEAEVVDDQDVAHARKGWPADEVRPDADIRAHPDQQLRGRRKRCHQ